MWISGTRRAITAGPAAADAVPAGAAKPGAISTQRRKVMERGAYENPDTARATGGTQRILRSASRGAAAGAYPTTGQRPKYDDGAGAQWY